MLSSLHILSLAERQLLKNKLLKERAEFLFKLQNLERRLESAHKRLEELFDFINYYEARIPTLEQLLQYLQPGNGRRLQEIKLQGCYYYRQLYAMQHRRALLYAFLVRKHYRQCAALLAHNEKMLVQVA